MDRDIILVTFNYRLNIFGFMSTEDEVVPGNNGLKDQVLALKWIQKNIASFGGNPKSVTLTGFSAGGGSVHLHYFSPMSRDLFHRGFSQSGVATNSWTLQKKALKKAKQLGESLGCFWNSSQVLVNCLKKKHFSEILKQMKQFFIYKTLPFSPFAPVVEKKGSKAFLTKNPYVLLKNGHVLDVPWIASNTKDDGTFPTLGN